MSEIEIDRTPSTAIGSTRFPMVRPEPTTALAMRQRVEVLPPAHDLISVDATFTAQRAESDAKSAEDRANATTQRTAVMVLILAGSTFLFVVLEVLSGAPWWLVALTLALFPVATIVGYYKLTILDYLYSSFGLEHHRIDAAVRLAEKKMDHDSKLRREITRAYLKTLGEQ